MKLINYPYNTTKYHLQKLQEAALIKCEKKGNILQYTINEKSKRFLHKFLEDRAINKE